MRFGICQLVMFDIFVHYFPFDSGAHSLRYVNIVL